MPNIKDRPYVGTWQNNMRQVVRHTPDAMVFLNGDLGLPGCERCRGRIDIQRYVTNISVEAGVLPGSHSANLSLSVPRISGEQLFLDGYNKLFPGLEVHIYMRGFFPVQGMFDNVPPESEFSIRGGGSGDYAIRQIPWEKMPTYPYYPVFHGVVTNVSYEYSAGEYHATINCASLLHFWQYHNMALNGSYLGSRPHNSVGKISFVGNTYNSMHPFELMYTLYRTVAGVPGGIAYALDEQSNLDAPLDSAGKTSGTSTWSQVLRYWEERFNSRIQNLRMYGVNGNLFNAAQQAFIGSRNHGVSVGELNHIITNSQYAEDGTLRPKREFLSGNLAIAKALGFERTGFDFTYTANQDPDANGEFREGEQARLNILDMFAFTQAAGDVGTFNTWESTYETKLQMAEAVMEVTGYEFYQDVDGDLVFKPPFYNLDTRFNRIYRIEEIDIISISFQEKEPEATWISVKPTWTKGATGYVPTEGALNKRAVYVDWKLVGQFGWRPANIEITYTVNTRSASYIGMARLDLLNVDINSCSLTIPIRPEMRPGIPVYIPSFDSFYYISQLSHNHTFGSQCTTSLTLTCRRRKFYAPGVPEKLQPGQDINDLIRLDRMDLPPRPIQIHDSLGIPRLAGFPNVVLALDPTRMNPKMLPVGAGLEHLDSTEDVRLYLSLIREDLKSQTPGIIQPVLVSQGGSTNSTSVELGDPNEQSKYKIHISEDKYFVFSLDDLEASFKDLQAARKEVDKLTKNIETRRDKLMTKNQIQSSFNLRGPAITKNAGLATLQDKLFRAQAAEKNVLENEQRGEFFTGNGDPFIQDEGVSNPNLFLRVTEAIRQNKGDPARRKVDEIEDGDVKATYLDLLTNLKSQYNSNGLPGYYRYYSASHSDPAQQGQPAVLIKDTRKRKPPAVTKGTGGGAAPASGVTPAPASSVDIDPINTDGLSDVERLRAMFKAAGVTWYGPSAVFSYRTRGGDKKLRGDATIQQVKDAVFTEDIANNVANISAVGQELLRRVQATPRWIAAQVLNPKLKQVQTSTWRPFSVTRTGKESDHALGRAIDLRPVGRDSKNLVIKEAFNQAYSALVAEAQLMANEGLIGGIGFYPRAGFVHIDLGTIRRWMQWTDKALITKDNEFGAFDVKCKKEGTGDTIIVTPRDQTPSVEEEKACVWWESVLRASDFPGGRNIPRNNFQTPFPAKGAKPPKAAPAPAPVPAPIPPPPPVPPSADLPPITLLDLDLPTPVQIGGFVLPTVDDPSIRAPEADIGIITATKGLIIARGPKAREEIVSTDRIQTVSFSKFYMNKNFSISSATQNGGEYFFKRKEFKRKLSNYLFAFAQEVGPTPESSSRDLFEGTWKDITNQLAEVDLPVYEDGTIKETKVIVPEDFDNLIVSTSGDKDELTFDDTNEDGVLFVDLPLQELKLIPGFEATGPTKQGKKGQNFLIPLRKVADTMAEALAFQMEGFFDGLQLLAIKPGKGRQKRLAKITDPMDKAAQMAVGDLTGEFKSTQKGGKIDSVEKLAKITRAMHASIRPISDGGGYEHFGSYRYGRGLTVEPGGSFGFIHNNDDPFGRISAQTAEKLLDVISKLKGGARRVDKEILKAEQAQLTRLITQIEAEGTVEAPTFDENLASEAFEEAQKEFDAEVRQRAELRLALATLNATPMGQEALQELLQTNGDNLDLVEGKLGRTQLEDKFINQTANYAKSPVFKTNVSNAAYRLTDLTAHLNDPSLKACSCKGSVSDVALAAFGRNQFAVVEGLDPEDESAESFVAEQMLTASVDFFYQQQALRGEVLNANQTPYAASFDNLKSLIGTSIDNAGTGFTSTGEQFSDIPEQFREIRGS